MYLMNIYHVINIQDFMKCLLSVLRLSVLLCKNSEFNLPKAGSSWFVVVDLKLCNMLPFSFLLWEKISFAL